MVQSIWLRLLFGSAIALSAADPAVSQAAPPTATKAAASDEFAARGQREARSIKYGDWQKLCFKPGGAKMVCRTTISGTFATGQTAVRDRADRDDRCEVEVADRVRRGDHEHPVEGQHRQSAAPLW